MNRLRIISHISIFSIAFCIFLQSSAYAQKSLDESIDCTDVQIVYPNDLTLTREERIRRMDNAFYKSLNQFELCQSELEKSATTAGASDGSSDNGTNNGNVKNGKSAESGNSTSTSSKPNADKTTHESVASSAISGTESPNENPNFENVEASDSGINSSSSQTNEANTTNSTQNTTGEGQRPADIPPSDNDNALAAQIRYAAENETDPIKKAQLWNEYRKYKGLPLKK